MIPDGYITGMGRNPGEDKLVTHLYAGSFNQPGLPMCVRGWNRSDGARYSIARNNVGEGGLCKVCLRRAQAGKPGVESRERKTRWL